MISNKLFDTQIKSQTSRTPIAIVASVLLTLPLNVIAQAPAGGTGGSGGSAGSSAANGTSNGSQNSTQRGNTNSNSNSQQQRSGTNQNSNTRQQQPGSNQNQNGRQQTGTNQNPNSTQQQPGTNQNQNGLQQPGTNQSPNPMQQQPGANQNQNGFQQPGTNQSPNSPQQQPGTNQNQNGLQQPGTNQSPNSTQQQPGTNLNQNGLQQPGAIQNTTTPQQQQRGSNQNRTAPLQGSANAVAAPNSPTGEAGVSFSGNIGAVTESGLSLVSSPNGTPTNFIFGPETQFEDSSGRKITRERFTSETPAMVYFVRSGNDKIASRVVAVEPPPAFSAGTITEVSPGVLVVELPGASQTPVRYVDNKSTNYVDQNGEPVPVESIKSGTAVKVYYTKVGDTLVASKIEVVRQGENPGLPKPPLTEDVNAITKEKGVLKP